jgi:poly-beta-1,6-N-acetyl-D-glucosamine synthase
MNEMVGKVMVFEQMTNSFFWIYIMVISIVYIMLAVFSYFEIARYLGKNNDTNFRRILSSSIAPSISLIAPAYNEDKSIIDNIRSLLSIQYHKFEIIIVNDGSTDETLKKAIEKYQLVPVKITFNSPIKTTAVHQVFRSNNPAFSKLVVIDKENGGKADALNAGLNFASNDLVACIDVDSIIEPDALLKMVKPFLEGSDRVIASGGVIRIANSCTVEGGRLIQTRLPQKLLAKFQVLEYLRAFLLGRLAWSRLNGLLIVSGAFGLFDKKVVISAGGYKTDTVGEDMELVVRIRRYMHERREKYKIVYIPEPLCWTEAPASLSNLGRQRSRWTRGTIETLLMHKRLFFNPAYGMMGMFSYPYWVLFEWLAPIIECMGILYFLIMVLTRQVNWLYAGLLFLVLLSFIIAISLFALVVEEISFNRYTTKRETMKLILLAFMDPFLFHPLIVFWSMKGNMDYLRGVKSWGKMTRKGFNSPYYIFLILTAWL